MSVRLHSYLHKNRYGVYGFRLVIPKNLHIHFAQKEYRFSLRTFDVRTAKSQAYSLASFVQHEFYKLQITMKPEEAQQLAESLISSLRNIDFEQQTQMLQALSLTANETIKTDIESLVSLRQRTSDLEQRKQDFLTDFAKSLENASETEIDTLTCDAYDELSDIKVEESEVAALIQKLTLNAQETFLNLGYEQNLSDLSEQFEYEKNIIKRTTQELVEKSTASLIEKFSSNVSRSKVEDKLMLSELIDAFCNSQKEEGRWDFKTEGEYRGVFALWLRIIGDQSAIDYTHKQHREYRSVVMKLPANLNKKAEFKGKSIEQILALEPEPAAIRTINKRLSHISSLYDWAIRFGYAETNPAQKMTLKNPKKASEERKVFTPQDLESIFGSDDYKLGLHKKPYQFWLPYLGLYTGARLNELCQLYLEDFSLVDGVHVFSINDDKDKRLKTKASRRLVPIHPVLIELGLLGYIEKLQNQGEERLFPELEKKRDGYGQVASKWFARYLTKCGIDEKGKVFHSFRHTVADHLKQADMPREKIAALIGHEDGSETFGRYGKDYKPSILFEVVKELDFPLLKRVLDEKMELIDK